MFGMRMKLGANEIKCITIHWLDCSKNTIVILTLTINSLKLQIANHYNNGKY